MGRREHDIYEHAVLAVIAQAADRKRDIYEDAILAVIAQQAAKETESTGREREPRPGGGMRGIWIGLALSLPIWVLITWWLLS